MNQIAGLSLLAKVTSQSGNYLTNKYYLSVNIHYVIIHFGGCKIKSVLFVRN